MGSHIRLLDEDTINKIAAGEVIENPASVVKELVENALDAGAQHLTVEIRGGGRSLIRVTDDGCGMIPDDALLCLERHATSKIRSIEDLSASSTMGFRGEALSSIAAVSKLSLLTSPHSDQGEGTLILVEGGRLVKCCSAARSQGTTLEVKSLFYNVPVRQRFQRSPSHDQAEILKVMTRLALGYPAVRMELLADEKPLLQAPESLSKSPLEALRERISQVLGKEFARSLLPVQQEQGTLCMVAFFSPPLLNRPNRTGQYLFINRRSVVSMALSAMVRESYGTALPSQRYPLFVLHFDLPADLVDANVHPRKLEVRLREENRLRTFLRQGVESSLTQASLMKEEARPLPFIVHENDLPWEIPSTNPQTEPLPEIPVRRSLPSRPSELPFAHEAALKISVLATVPGYMVAKVDSGTPLPLFPPAELVVVDQRAAHSRVLFEQLDANTPLSFQESQGLLTPLSIELSTPEAMRLLQQIDDLKKMGFLVRPFGSTTFLVDAIPALVAQEDAPSLLLSLIADLDDSSTPRVAARQAEAAERAALPPGRKLSCFEAQNLLDKLLKCRLPYQSPRGRPTLIPLSSEALARCFSR